MCNSKIKKILITIFLFIGFWSCKSTTKPEGIIEYVPGQVIVGFVDSVSYQFAFNFCETENLEILRSDLGHNFWAVADSNNLEYYQKLFSDDSTIIFIDELLSNSSIDTLLITITFSGVNSLAHDFENLNLAGLKVYKTSKRPAYALVKTAIDKEQYYINKLTNYNFIRYAELNYISHIN